MEAALPFDTLVMLLIYVFLALAMLCIGMNATLGDMLSLARERTRLARAIIANIVIPPVIALALVLLFPMHDAVTAVLLLLAFAPGGINAVQFSTKSPGQLAAAGELMILLSAISLILAPVAATFVLPSGATPSVPIGPLAFRIIILVVAPLLIGMMIRSVAPDIAERIYKPAMLVSTLSFVVSVILSLSVRQDALAEFSTGSVLAMLCFILILMATGWILGGAEQDYRQVLAVTTNLRNVGLVYVLVDGCCADDSYSTALFAFMAIMVPANLALTIICAILRKRRER